MKFLQELHINTVELLEESAGKGSKKKNMFVEGVFMQSDIVNRNKRLYPKSIMEKALGKYQKNFVDQNRAVGELGHPKTPVVIEKNVSHRITKLIMEGKDVYGKALILNTDNGKQVKEMLKGEVNLGVSSRGAGTLRQDPLKGHDVVQEDFVISTAADIVLNPSAPNAFVNAIMENEEWVYDAGSEEWKKTGMEKAQKRLRESKKSHRKGLAMLSFEEFVGRHNTVPEQHLREFVEFIDNIY